MNATLRASLAGALLAASLAAVASAQAPGNTVTDRGRLVVFSHDRPVATERFLWERGADSLVITSTSSRTARKPDGTLVKYEKSMQLVVGANDFGLVNYTSNESSEGKTVIRSILPGDTALTVYVEVAGERGAADRLVRPPGRFFALDPGLYSLFDVIGRNLQHRLFGPRPVGVVTMGASNNTAEVTAIPLSPDTVSWGGHRVITDRIELADSTSTFTLWLSPEGHMLRLQNDAVGLVVMREPPPAAPARRTPRPKPRAR